MKIKVTIYDPDEQYLHRVSKYYAANYDTRLELYCFTGMEQAMKSLTENKVQVFLASTEGAVDFAQVPARCAFAWLIDSSTADEYQGKRAVLKYQKLESIYSEILDIYSEKMPHGTVKADEGAVEIVAFVSAAGGVGCSTVSAACAAFLARRGRRVLYLNLEHFGGAEFFYRAGGSGSLSNVLFAVNSKRANLALKLESLVRKDGDSGVFFYSAAENAMDMNEVNAEFLTVLLNALRGSESYDTIVLDLNFQLSELCLEALKQANRIVLLSDGRAVTNKKTARAVAALLEIQEERGVPYYDKISLLYNKYSNRTSTDFTDYELPALGGIPRFEGADSIIVYQKIAELQVFGHLMQLEGR
jgi:cellulose biosynthesis protein BcsQ